MGFILFCWMLSRKFFEQLPTGSIILYFVVQFVDVKGHRDEENLSPNLLASAKEKLPKTIVLLDDSESAFDLD